jgi:hypothetical protein
VKLALALLLLAAPLAAQGDGGSANRLAGRVPPAALPVIDSLIAVAIAESLPSEPLVQKALEGGAKGIPAARLVSGVRRSLLQLREARIIVSRARPGEAPEEAHVAAVSAALARGLDSAIVERLVGVAPDESPGPVLHAEADLIAHRFNSDSAADLLVEAHNKGLHGMRLLDVAVAANHELQRAGGRTHADALAHVRALLPNVPAAPR